jgi:hypothetical protein
MTKAKPYVYRCEHKNNGNYYFGVRTGNWLPAKEDLGIHYFTSSNIVQPCFNEYLYEVLSEYDNPEQAFMVEQNLIWNSRKDKKLLNRNCKSGGFQDKFGNSYPTKRERRENHPLGQIKCPIQNIWIDPEKLTDIEYLKNRIQNTQSKKNLKKWAQLLVKALK